MSSLQCQRKISQRAFEGKLREFHVGEQNIIILSELLFLSDG